MERIGLALREEKQGSSGGDPGTRHRLLLVGTPLHLRNGNPTPTGVAVVGMGRWGKNLIRAFSKCARVTLCCNRSRSEAHVWLREHYPGVRASFDPQDAFADTTIEAVAIATPVPTHAELAARALQAGKHVFVEKPLAMSVDEAERVMACARQAQRRLVVGHTLLFDRVFEELCALTRDDAVQHARLAWSKLGTFDEELVWNLLPHEVAIAIALLGETPEQTAVLERRGVHTRTDFARVRLDFAAGRSCDIEIDRCAPCRRKTLTVATRGGQLLVWEGATLYRWGPGPRFDPILRRTEEPLVREVRAFLRSLCHDGPTRSDGAFGLEVVRILAQVADALQEGREPAGATTPRPRRDPAP